MEFKTNVSLKPYTSWQIGGPADYFCEPESVDDLKETLYFATQKSIPITILSGGSNILVSDAGIRGLTVCLKKFAGTKIVEEDDRLQITALAGTSKTEILKIFLKYQLPPAIFIAGIPGDVGGGVVMNAGVGESIRPREFVEIVDWVEVMRPNGEIVCFDHHDLHWVYRHCYGWQPGIITRVGLSWPLDPDETVLQKVRDANKVRSQKQPLDKPSCGSVFVNPEGYKAAQLIDECGLKGFSFGDAQVSTKHANFIVNNGHATAEDVWKLITHIQKVVLEKKSVELKTEVIRMG